MKTFFIFLISLYQKLVSPFLGNNCRFYPTCSEYAKESFSRFGFFTAFFISSKRILKCHPYCEGGLDPVPHSNPFSPAPLPLIRGEG